MSQGGSRLELYLEEMAFEAGLSAPYQRDYACKRLPKRGILVTGAPGWVSEIYDRQIIV